MVVDLTMALYLGTRSKLYRYSFLNFIRHYGKPTLVSEYKVNQPTLPHQPNKNTIKSSSDIYKNIKKIEITPALVPSQIERLRIQDFNQSILSAENVKVLFTIYLQNKSTYKLDQYLHTTKRLSEFSRMGLISLEKLNQSAVFQSLCYDIWKLSSRMEANMSLSLYRNLLLLKLNTNSLIMQSLLQMIRHQINLFSIKELLLLHTMLHNSSACPLKSALLLAVPIVIENCIRLHLSPNLKYGEVCQLLRICIDAEVEGLPQVLDHIFQLSLPQILSQENSPSSNPKIVSLLSNVLNFFLKTDISHSETVRNIAHTLLVNCVQFLVKYQLEGVDKDLVLILVTKMTKCVVTERNEEAFPQEFLDVVVRKGMDEEWDLGALCHLIKKQIQLNNLSDDLITHCMSDLTRNLDQVISLQLNTYPIISALALTTNPLQQMSAKLHNLSTIQFNSGGDFQQDCLDKERREL